MTQEPIIDKLGRLEREATPGEWSWTLDTPHYRERICKQALIGGNGFVLHADESLSAADAELIALAPSLLSQLREAQERAERAEHALYESALEDELSEDAIRIAEAYGVRLIDELEKFR